MGRVADGNATAREYDAMAADYAAHNAVGSYNAYYERPATIALLGDVNGRRVLEAGCGAGVLTTLLADRGAAVTAFDVSPAMLELARLAIGDRAELLVADLSRPLSFAPDGRFDLVVASLVLHYIRDWEAVLREFRRVLKPDGAVVFSTHHPAMDWRLHSADDYFAVKHVTEIWRAGSGEYEVSFWRRPLTAMCDAIAAAGFVIERLTEPEPLPELADRDPEAYQAIRTKPRFLFFRLRPTTGR
jgi:ubiquinone/menaquinone biosynthesis C-methylase UbiE